MIIRNHFIQKSFFLLFFLSVVSCSKQSTETRYYPNQELFETVDLSNVINLETTSLNFKEITDRINSDFDNPKTILAIEFQDDSLKKRVTPLVYQPLSLYKGKNNLRVTRDSVFRNFGYPIEDIQNIMRKQYANNGKITDFCDSPEKCWIEISIDTAAASIELKEALIKVTRSYDLIQPEIAELNRLMIFFDHSRQSRLPPPPPPQPSSSQ